MSEMNQSHKRVLKYMVYEHLPKDLQKISKPLCDLSYEMELLCRESNDPAEVTVGLRKIMEAKDCFVRAML